MWAAPTRSLERYRGEADRRKNRNELMVESKDGKESGVLLFAAVSVRQSVLTIGVCSSAFDHESFLAIT